RRRHTRFSRDWSSDVCSSDLFNYSSLSNTSEAFDELLANNPYLRNSFEQKFIAGLNYSFVYNEVNDIEKKAPIYFAANFEIAGNALSLLSGDANENETEKILGMEYAQFIRTDIDLRYQDRKSTRLNSSHVI